MSDGYAMGDIFDKAVDDDGLLIDTVRDREVVVRERIENAASKAEASLGRELTDDELEELIDSILTDL